MTYITLNIGPNAEIGKATRESTSTGHFSRPGEDRGLAITANMISKLNI